METRNTNQGENEMTTYETAAQTAKKIRQVLKFWFPGFKFSVTSKSYSGGSSVSVSWTDGAAFELVNNLVNGMNSATFDGMIDLKETKYYSWNGETFRGADWIHVQREISEEFTFKTCQKICDDYRVKLDKENWYNQVIDGQFLSGMMREELRTVNI